MNLIEEFLETLDEFEGTVEANTASIVIVNPATLANIAKNHNEYYHKTTLGITLRGLKVYRSYDIDLDKFIIK